MVRKLDLPATTLVTGLGRMKPYTVEMPEVLDPQESETLVVRLPQKSNNSA